MEPQVRKNPKEGKLPGKNDRENNGSGRKMWAKMEETPLIKE